MVVNVGEEERGLPPLCFHGLKPTPIVPPSRTTSLCFDKVTLISEFALGGISLILAWPDMYWDHVQ